MGTAQTYDQSEPDVGLLGYSEGKQSIFLDAETGNVNAINNSGSAIMMNDDSVALNAGGNGIAISDEGILLNTNGINEDIKLVTKGTSVSVDSNGTTFTNTNTNETTNINGGTINVGDKLMVEEDGSIYMEIEFKKGTPISGKCGNGRKLSKKELINWWKNIADINCNS